LPGEHVHHHVALVEAQQAVVDEHAGELVADGAVDQGRGHRGIDAAGQAQDHFLVADLLRIASTASAMWSRITQSGRAWQMPQHEALEQRASPAPCA
jgi:hypothetical protein